MQTIGEGRPLTADGLAAAAGIVGVGLPELWTVIAVETSGRGFLPDRRPVILFERHEFRRRTGGRFDATHPGISGPPGGYGPGGAHQHDRLAEAIVCNRRAALESASWGLGQVMGYNAVAAGFADAELMCARMMESEDAQVAGMARFIRAGGLHVFLQRRDWAAFASHYNGPAYARNAYDTKLAQAHARLTSGAGLPDLRLRAVQLLLGYQGADPGPIDGRMGQRTEATVRAFRAKRGLPDAGRLDDALMEALYRPAVAPADIRREPSRAPIADPAPDFQLIQLLLAACGFDPGAADGRPGPRTSRAIAAFRARVGLPGEAVDRALFDALCTAVVARPADRAVVRLAQTLLTRLGFDPGTADGLMGARTSAALRRFSPQTDRIDAAVLRLLLSRAVASSNANTFAEVVS